MLRKSCVILVIVLLGHPLIHGHGNTIDFSDNVPLSNNMIVNHPPENVNISGPYFGRTGELTEYTFYSEEEHTKNRFSLIFSKEIQIDTEESFKIYSYDNNIVVEIYSGIIDAEIQIFNLLGQKILHEKTNSSINHLSLNVETGNYIVKVINGDEQCTEKIYIQ